MASAPLTLCCVARVEARVIMPSRFVEVSRPVEDSIKWASSFRAAMGSRIGLMLPRNTTSRLVARMADLRDIRVIGDLSQAIEFVVACVPPVKQEVQVLIVSSVVFFFLRVAFLFWRSRSILATYGAAKVLAKEI